MTDSKKHTDACTCNKCIQKMLANADETMRKAELAFDFVQSIHVMEQAFKGDFIETKKSLRAVSNDYLSRLRIAGLNIANMAVEEQVKRVKSSRLAA